MDGRIEAKQAKLMRLIWTLVRVSERNLVYPQNSSTRSRIVWDVGLVSTGRLREGSLSR